MKTALPTKLTERIRSACSADGLPLFVYGAGVYAAEIEAFLSSENIPVAGFFVGDQFVGGPHCTKGGVLSITTAMMRHPHFHTIIGFCRDPRAIDDELVAKGVGGSGKRFVIDCRFWREFDNLDEAYLRLQAKDLQIVRDLFSDELSRQTFDAIIATKLTRDPAPLADIVTSRQYFPLDLPAFAPHPDDVVVDAGAFTGDTLSEYLDISPHRRCKAYHAFEPDPINCSSLEEYVHVEHLDFVHLHKVALGASEGKASFTARGTSTSRLEQSSDFEVKVLSLDSLKLEPTFIKMDIEGAEDLALRGARQSIVRGHPRLAITIYHSFTQFLGVPRLVKAFCEDYRLYLRAHRPYTEEFVLYATQ